LTHRGTYFFVHGRHQVQEHAPEEVAARIAQELARERGTAAAGDTGDRRVWSRLDWLAAGTLSAAVVALLWVLLMAYDVLPDDAIPVGGAITLLIVILGAALLSVAAVALLEMGKAAPAAEQKPVAPATGDSQPWEALP
jgi:hypothetical protein